MRVGSLFAGVGGFDLGFERAGMQTVWQVEQNAYCRAVLAQHFPDAQRFEDVCEVGAGELEPVDLICGGFPCQDLSGAGKGAGIDGAQSGLWSEFARIVRELRPRYVVVENVPDLLVGRGKRWPVAPASRVLGDLAAAGYDAEWSVLSAAEFGAPHLRERVWIVAYPQREGEPQPEGSESDQRRRASDGGGEIDGENLADAHGQRREGRSGKLRAAGRGQPADGGGDVADPDADRCRKGLRESSGRDERPRQGDAERSSEHLQDPDECALQPWRIGGRAAQTGGPEWWAIEPPVGRVAHGIPNRLDRLSALGNALVPQIAQWIGERILAYEQPNKEALKL